MELTVKIWILCFYLLTLRNTVPSSQPTQSPRFLLVFSLSLCHSLTLSLSLSKLLYKSVTIAIPPKIKVTKCKQIQPIYQMYNFNTS